MIICDSKMLREVLAIIEVRKGGRKDGENYISKSFVSCLTNMFH